MLGQAPRIYTPVSLGISMVALALSLLLAHISWTRFERRFVRFGHRWPYHPQPANPRLAPSGERVEGSCLATL